jgi:hypothetical protein
MAEWMLRNRCADRDAAKKAAELSDLLVCTTWGVKGKDHRERSAVGVWRPP